jgi:hypothetical protein
MPLLTKMLPLRETVEDFHASSLHSSQHHQQEKGVREEKDKDSGYEDFREFDDEECLDSDMEGSVDSMMHRGRPRKVVRAPAIPARNEKRASRILDNVMMELKAMDGITSKEPDTRSTIQESDPHESYLSSEEDASLSDDYEDTDSLHDSSGTTSPSLEDGTSEEATESFTRRSRRKSQEDTARVVSFICVGKPQIVDIFIHSNHTSPVESNSASPAKRHSMNLDALTALTQSPPAKIAHRPTPLKLYPTSIRRLSISSITSSHTSTSSTNIPSNTNNPTHPLRKSSRLANLTALVTTTKNTFQTSFSAPAVIPTHSFLTSDPFSTSQSQTQNEDQPTTPKTPTSMAAQAWKRTLNKARRPSMPKLSLAYANSSMTNLSSPISTSSSPDKRGSRRVSTSHSNLGFSKDGLARIISENSSRTSVYSSNSGSNSQDTTQSQHQPQQPSIKRSETMPIQTPTPTTTPTTTSYIPLSQPLSTILNPKPRIPPPIPTEPSNNGRRSFSFGVGMGLGLGRKKSVKAR